MRKALELLKLEVFDMNDNSVDEAFCDGGDVLFTGAEFFVGNSKRTTVAGGNFLKTAFGFPVHMINVDDELHLKSNCTMICPGKIVFSDDKAGNSLASQFKVAAKSDYEYVFVPDIKASNVVYIKTTDEKEHILMPSGYEKSEKILLNAISGMNINVIRLDNSELGKVDGCLTCCSVLA